MQDVTVFYTLLFTQSLRGFQQAQCDTTYLPTHDTSECVICSCVPSERTLPSHATHGTWVGYELFQKQRVVAG